MSGKKAKNTPKISQYLVQSTPTSQDTKKRPANSPLTEENDKKLRTDMATSGSPDMVTLDDTKPLIGNMLSAAFTSPAYIQQISEIVKKVVEIYASRESQGKTFTRIP